MVSADDAIPAEPVAVTPDPAPVETPTPEPVAPAPDPVADLRERNARLEGEMAALRTQVAAATAPRVEAPAQWNPENIRAAYDAGQITDDQRVALLAKLQSTADLAEYDAGRRLQDTEARAGTTLQEYLRAYPALNDATSPLMREIAAELGEMQASERANPRSLVAQLRAVKSILGPLKTAATSTARRQIPVGAVGTPGGGAPARGGGADPLKGIPEEHLADWRRMGANLDDPKRAQFYAARYWGARGRSRTA